MYVACVFDALFLMDVVPAVFLQLVRLLKLKRSHFLQITISLAGTIICYRKDISVSMLNLHLVYSPQLVRTYNPNNLIFLY